MLTLRAGTSDPGFGIGYAPGTARCRRGWPRSQTGPRSRSLQGLRMAEITRVAVVGAGTMGSQIALQTAYAGRYEVAVVDSSAEQLERARAQNEQLVRRGVERGRLTEERAANAVGCIRTTTD